jgi:hypothetical protein
MLKGKCYSLLIESNEVKGKIVNNDSRCRCFITFFLLSQIPVPNKLEYLHPDSPNRFAVAKCSQILKSVQHIVSCTFGVLRAFNMHINVCDLYKHQCQKVTLRCLGENTLAYLILAIKLKEKIVNNDI